MIIKSNLIRVVKNVKAMLIDRGYDAETIPNSDYTNILEYKIDEFLRSEGEKTNRILDFFVTGSETKDYVFFYKGSDKGLKISRAFFIQIEKYAKKIEALKGLNINFDNISFILAKKEIDKNDQLLIDNFESRNNHIRIFSYTKFLFNITSHQLVPLHTLYRSSYSALLHKLMLKSINQLPYIMYNDPIARHFNFREDEIIEITRNTLGKEVVVYRVCKNFNYTNMNRQAEEDITDDKPKEKKFESKKELQTEEVLEEESSEEESVESEEESEEEMDKIKWDDNKFVQFYSDSKTTEEFSKNKLRYLSNFHKISGNGYVVIEGNNYSTIEHYFQAQKFLPEYHAYESDDEKENLIIAFNKFVVDGEFDNPEAKKPLYKWGLSARSQGGKTAMKKQGFTNFKVDNWNTTKLEIMKKGIEERFRHDMNFRKILLEMKKKNKALFHFERTGKFWGGNRPKSLGGEYWTGENKLGEIMNNLITKQKKSKKKKIKVQEGGANPKA